MKSAVTLAIFAFVQNVVFEQVVASKTLSIPCMFYCPNSNSNPGVNYAPAESHNGLDRRRALLQQNSLLTPLTSFKPVSGEPQIFPTTLGNSAAWSGKFSASARTVQYDAVPSTASADSQRTFSARDSGSALFDNGPPSSSASAAPLTNGGVDMQKLFSALLSREVQQLEQPYDSGPRQPKNERIDEDVVMLPQIVETKPGSETFVDHRYPDENKNQVINTIKEIHAYTVQKKRINVHNTVVHRHHKLVNINTDYIVNIRRVAHPHKLTETFVETETRHVPFIYVKHTRADKVRDEGKPTELATEEVRENATDLPPVYDTAVIKQLNYDRSQRPPPLQSVEQQQQITSVRGSNNNSPPSFTLLMPQMAS